MNVHDSVEPVTDGAGGDFGLAEHLAEIERMHREALAQLDALGRPWAHLWSVPPAPTPLKTEDFPVVAQPLVLEAPVDAA